MLLFVGLGSNLGARAATLRSAARLLAECIGPLLILSPFYETAPEGFASPHRFLNAAAAYETALDAWQLLDASQAVERALGRRQKSRDGIYHDRPIDIDLLYLEGTTLSTPGLTLPHPRMLQRQFVVRPLLDVLRSGVFDVSRLPADSPLARLLADSEAGNPS